MFSYCRLCAEQKKVSELKKTVFDWGIKEKLVACCMWKPSSEEYTIPQTVCNDCIEQLENVWQFALRISESEQKLIQIVHFSSNELDFKQETPNTDHEFIEMNLDVPDDELGVEEASSSASETESEHSKGSRRVVRKARGVKKKQQVSKLFNISKIVSKDDCNLDGTVTDEGVAKMELSLTSFSTKTWNDCEFKCNDCDYNAKGFNKFHTHDQTSHSPFLMKRSFQCLFCQQVCKRLQSLVVHISYRHLPHLSYWFVEIFNRIQCIHLKLNFYTRFLAFQLHILFKVFLGSNSIEISS